MERDPEDDIATPEGPGVVHESDDDAGQADAAEQGFLDGETNLMGSRLPQNDREE